MDGGKPREKQPKAENPKEDDKEKVEVVATDKDDTKAADTNGKPKQEVDADNPKVKAEELRVAYKGLKKKVKEEYEPQIKELSTLRAKVKEFEERGESQTKTTQEEIAAVKKRNAELENHIRFANYEQSKEYQEQFQKPYEDAWGNALRELKGLTMKIEDSKTGEEIVREVTQADIAYFANLDPAARRTEINRLFPEDKEEVKRHINQISHLADKSEQAKAKAKADAETHAKAQTEQQQQSQQARAKFWKESNEALAAKYPKWFAKADDDAEGNTLFDRGTALADLAFNPNDLSPERIAMLPKSFKEQIESGKPFTPSQLTQLHSIVRNKAANHDRLAQQNKTLTARIEELEKSLKEYETSGPDNVPAGDGVRQTNGVHDPGTELEAIARKFA